MGMRFMYISFMIAYLIGSVELRLGVDDGGRVLVQRRHELRQARGLLGEGLLGPRGPHPAPAPASPAPPARADPAGASLLSAVRFSARRGVSASSVMAGPAPISFSACSCAGAGVT